MYRRMLSTFLLGLLSGSAVLAAQSRCGPGSNCPEDSPCCGQYGGCGVGAYCLGGCEPRWSFDLNSCVPRPACQNKDYTMDNLKDIADISTYLGDATKANWVSSGKVVSYNDQGLLLTMAQGTVGTLLATTHYVWYGKMSCKMVTSAGAGVVTAFITMSDSKDEIDFEFVGVDLDTAQSNFYSEGITVYTNGENITAPSTNTVEHEYTIDWTPDLLTWAVDGKILRTLKRSDTWNTTSMQYNYPQTPSRVQLSLWPAGLPDSAKGTIEWAGGIVDWGSPYMQNGYYYALVTDVSVECYDPPAGANIKGKNSYIYTDRNVWNTSIQMVDDIVVLASLYATGNNPDYNPYASSASPSSLPTAQTVPGVSGIGTRGDIPGGEQNSASGSSTNTGTGSSGFSQGSNRSGADSVNLGTKGSVFAVLIAVMSVCFWL